MQEAALDRFRLEDTDKNDKTEYGGLRAFVLYKLLPVLTFSSIAGAVVGVVVSFFNILLDLIRERSSELAKLVNENLPYLPLYILGALLIAVVMYFLIKKLPEARGSGVPRSEAMLVGKKNLNWLHMAAGTIIGSVLSFGAGLSVGAEGPSVQLGASLGEGIGFLKGRSPYRRYTANAGAAAGVATAFGAPFTGIIFVQEEVQRRFNSLMVASCCLGVAYSSAVHNSIYAAMGKSIVFFGAGAFTISSNMLRIAILIGAVAAVAAYLFNGAIFGVNKLSKRSKIKTLPMLLIVFAITAIVSALLPASFGGGFAIANTLLTSGMDWRENLILFVVKIALVLLVFRSGATGGMMVPMLAIGALLGGLIASLGGLMGLDASMFTTIAAVTMCAFFGAAICAPFTSVILLVETTGGFSALPFMLIAALTAMLIGRLIGQKPLYDALAESEADREGFAVFDKI